jgi:hypothetical protein
LLRPGGSGGRAGARRASRVMRTVHVDDHENPPLPRHGWGTATTLGYLILIALGLLVALLLQAAGMHVF